MALRVMNQYHDDIIIGGYGARRGRSAPDYDGPDPASSWLHNRIGYYQEVHGSRLVDVEYTSPDGISIKVYQLRRADMNILDNTFNMMPPSHLDWINQHKPEGFIVADSAGRGRFTSYTGGLNASYDDSSTSFFDELNGIIITYGAFWKFQNLGICPSIFHETGHVLTRRSRISYNFFPEGRRNHLSGTRVSRNPGSLEALCNTYMFFICYGSDRLAIRNFGTGNGLQNDAITRNALRQCPAFSSMLSPVWVRRFEER